MLSIAFVVAVAVSAYAQTAEQHFKAGLEFYDQKAYGQDWTWSNWKNSLGSGPNNYVTFTFGPYNSKDSWGGFHHFYCIIPPTDVDYGESTIGSYSTGTED